MICYFQTLTAQSDTPTANSSNGSLVWGVAIETFGGQLTERQNGVSRYRSYGVSGGVTLQKRINSRIAIETGLYIETERAFTDGTFATTFSRGRLFFDGGSGIRYDELRLDRVQIPLRTTFRISPINADGNTISIGAGLLSSYTYAAEQDVEIDDSYGFISLENDLNRYRLDGELFMRLSDRTGGGLIDNIDFGVRMAVTEQADGYRPLLGFMRLGKTF